jgi:hypothetical protein
MSKLSWMTPIGTIANLLISEPASFALQAYDSANNGATLTYTKLGGDLPAGMTMASTGIISGTPTYGVITDNYFTTRNFNFTVSVTSSNANVMPIYGNFTIIITNVLNNDFVWVTPSGTLGTVPEGTFYSLQLLAESTSAVTYKLISGKLPSGMRVTTSGLLQGVPSFYNAVAVDQSETFRFSVRATNGPNHIVDRSFDLTVTSVAGPTIVPTTTDLGTFFDGSFYSQQLDVVELNSSAEITWSVSSGSLPVGVTLSNTGLLSGYIQPLELVGTFGPDGFDSDDVPAEGGDGVILQRAEYDYAPYDFNNLSLSLAHSFTIRAYDGANYDLQDYVIQVLSRSGFTADSSNSINNTYITVDAINITSPVILNTERTLPPARQNSYYAYKFEGYDFAGDTITYSTANTIGTFDAEVVGTDNGFDYLGTVGFDSFDPNESEASNLPGLFLDPVTGWLYGKLTPSGVHLVNFRIGISVSKEVDSVVYAGPATFFTLPIFGDVNDVIQWSTPAGTLGSINNGAVSEFSIKATNKIGNPVWYGLADQRGISCRLPQGLSLLETGEISGRVSFESFSLDGATTTFDNTDLTIDRTYTFTVEVRSGSQIGFSDETNNTSNDFREFIINLNVVDTIPYENLYLRAMPAYDQRQIFTSLVTDTDIFPSGMIYRENDPWFGISTDMTMLFLTGLTPTTLADYKSAIELNHWSKAYNFGSVKTAVVLDDFYNVKYEVVYIDIVDPEENTDGTGPGLEIDLGDNANSYIDADGNVYSTIYPNTTNNMITRLTDAIDYSDQSSLPPWMTSNQPDPTSANKFRPPLGYTKAVVLAYTIPDASKLIAYRIRNTGINFNNIEFSVNKYEVDDYYSTNYSISDERFISGPETTFDYLPVKNIGNIVYRVNYAVSVPFNQINGRTTEYIIDNNRLDSADGIFNGQTLIFAKQEQFTGNPANDGWIDTLNSNALIPGFLEKNSSIDSFTADGVSTFFTVNTTITDATPIAVYLNQTLVSSTEYNIVGNSIHFNVAPAAPVINPNIRVVHSSGTVDLFSGTGGTVNFTMSETESSSANFSVYVDGIQLNTSSYSAAGSILTFSTAPANPATPTNIDVYYGVNKRGGIWQVSIVDNVVELIFIQEVQPNQRIQVLNGALYNGAIVYYDPITSGGLTVPYYATWNLPASSISTKTTFNGGSTKFFSNRDQYYSPNEYDKYLHFPQHGAFK